MGAVVTVGPSDFKVNAFLSGKMPSGSTKSMHTTLETKTNTHQIFLQKFGNLGSHICVYVSLSFYRLMSREENGQCEGFLLFAQHARGRV